MRTQEHNPRGKANICSSALSQLTYCHWLLSLFVCDTRCAHAETVTRLPASREQWGSWALSRKMPRCTLWKMRSTSLLRQTDFLSIETVQRLSVPPLLAEGSWKRSASFFRNKASSATPHLRLYEARGRGRKRAVEVLCIYKKSRTAVNPPLKERHAFLRIHCTGDDYLPKQSIRATFVVFCHKNPDPPLIVPY